MSTHLREEDLILHFYGDGPREREAGVDAHLRECATCQSAWVEIQDTLKLVDGAAVPEPDPDFERVIWARVQNDLRGRFTKNGKRTRTSV